MAKNKAFSNLSAKQQRGVVLGAVSLVIVIGFFALRSASVGRHAPAPVSADNLLTGADSRALGIGSLNAALSKERGERASLARELAEMKALTERQSKRLEALEKPAPSSGLAAMPNGDGGLVARPVGVVPGITNPTPDAGSTERFAARQAEIEALRRPGGPVNASGNDAAADPLINAPVGKRPAPAIITSGVDVTDAGTPVPPAPVEPVAEPAHEEGMFLPAGTIITTVLLSGMDAPTGRSAQTQPLPVLARVKTDANLPNRFRADVRECRIVGSTWGDLSSERAFIRSETMTCIRNDGGTIEVKMKMFATGEDGKVGLRGPVVEKRGAMVGRAALAGFLGGVATAFQPQRIPTISTNGGNEAQFQQMNGPGAAQAAAYGGISGAADRLADYYIKRADELVPVIEVSAGREATFIVQEGKNLVTKG